jgi:hypothetical protein
MVSVENLIATSIYLVKTCFPTIQQLFILLYCINGSLHLVCLWLYHSCQGGGMVKVWKTLGAPLFDLEVFHLPSPLRRGGGMLGRKR